MDAVTIAGTTVPEVADERKAPPAPTERAVADVLAELDGPFTGKLPVAAIREIQRRRDEFVPGLVGLLRSATERARQGQSVEPNGHFYALYLLAEFGAVESLPAIVGAILLPGDGPDELFGDAITTDLDRILARFTDPDGVLLDRIIADRTANEYVRNAAIQAYVLLVRDGRIPCDEAVRRLQGHLRTAMALWDAEGADPRETVPDIVHTWLVNGLCDLDPGPALDDIRTTFGRHLVDESILGLDEIDEAIREGAAGLAKRQARLAPTKIEDTVDELENWACYAPHDEPVRPGGIDDLSDDEYARLWNQAKCEFLDEYSATDDLDLYARETVEPIRNAGPKVGRNDPCPCGSGKKSKKCCGKRD